MHSSHPALNPPRDLPTRRPALARPALACAARTLHARRLLLATLAALATGLAVSAHADTPLQEFEAARQRWQQAGIANYSFTLRQLCFCPGRGEALRVEVRGGVVRAAQTLPGGEAVDAPRLAVTPSLDTILAQVAQAYARGAEQVDLRLNPQYGYPEHVFIDYSRLIADEELHYEVSDFAP